MALSKQAVVDAALEILDSYGLADLTMRRLGEVLGVRAGALYHHVPNKQSLLAALADAILAEVDELDWPAAPPWQDAVAAWASGLRAALLRHRDSADLVATARAMGLAERDASARPTALLADAGLPDAQAAASASALLHFVLGHVAEEQARLDWERFGSAEPSQRRATDQTFAVGVRLIVDGLGVRLDPTA